MGGLSKDNISTPAQTMTMSAMFPVHYIITPLLNKHVHDSEDLFHKSSPLLVKLHVSTSKNDFHGGCPILEEVPPQ